jgi:hypothetical protein
VPTIFYLLLKKKHSSESSGENVHEMIVRYVTEVLSEDKQVSIKVTEVPSEVTEVPSKVTEVLSEDRKKVSNEVPCEDKDICEADSKVDQVLNKNVKVEIYKRAGPYKAELEGRSTEFEVHTGLAFSLISKTIFTELFPNKTLSDSKVNLKTYSGEKIKLEGECQIEVKHNRKSNRLKMYVTHEQGGPLMGHDWLMKIPLDWRKITFLNVNKSYQTNDELSKVLNKYEQVFSESPGKLKGVTGKLSLKQGVIPKALKVRNPPYMYRSLIELEVDC